MCLYYSIPQRVSVLSEVSGHFSGSINSEQKGEMQYLIQLLAADGVGLTPHQHFQKNALSDTAVS